MAVRIIYAEVAQFDLKSIYNYIKRDSPFYAKREVTLIREAIRGLKKNVFIGRKFEKFESELIRELIFKNYLIVYQISENETMIQILTIHHHARLLSNNRAFFEGQD